MAEPVIQKETRTLKSFCVDFVHEHGLRKIHKSEFLAMELRRFYNIRNELSLDDLIETSKYEMGISDIEFAATVGNADGVFCKLGAYVSLQVKQRDSEVAHKFTIAHEIREVIGAFVKDVHPRFKDAKGNELENEADVFASTLILGEDAFVKNMWDSGLDPIRLCQLYKTSCRTSLFRMARTLTAQPNSPFFWFSVLYRRGKDPSDFLSSSGSCRNPKFSCRSRDKVPNLLFPKRGQLVPVVGVLQQSFENKKSVFIDKVSGLDYWDNYSLSAIIRPYIVRSDVKALIVIAVPRKDSAYLSHQILRVRPLRTEEYFQLY